MKITIFGASGSVGIYVVEEAVNRGHQIVAASRTRKHVSNSPLVSNIVVDYNDIPSIENALLHSDAVLIIFSGSGDVVLPTKNVLQAMHNKGIKRVELLTAFGSSQDARKQLNMLTKLALIPFIPFLSNMANQNKLVSESGLDYTIVMPPWLTHKKNKSAYKHGEFPKKSILGRIRRINLADFLINNIENNTYCGESVYIQE
ncbi:Putative NADH-flavin reductase [Enterococcus casseliflavus]|uniref:NAD(P)-dependent oxidoreductase n=1 Tax=Enterococcus casseliflavus TaxID=37734 RepID=UPI000E08402D|nr:NAD(P)-binding oxidoreductase [Enterococcus casseliflavus]GEB30380.1 hypothetical protein ECA02_34750 [Enterococcus casseliflavus]STP33365.1 Putative NADH-flavin reductase [Enterococcus casseliflavus]